MTSSAMCYKSTSQHPTTWPSTRLSSTASSWQKKSAFGASCAMATLTWWCSNAQEVGMQRMQIWQAIGSWSSRCAVPSRGVNSIMCPELRMMQQMHSPSWALQENPFLLAYLWSTSRSRRSRPHQNQSPSLFRPSWNRRLRRQQIGRRS